KYWARGQRATVRPAADGENVRPAFRAPAGTTASELHVRVEDTPAAGQRLWVRGRLHGPLDASSSDTNGGRWWRWWKGKGSPPPTTARLETRVGSQVFGAEVTLHHDGRFETTFTGDLPVARRGWRVARNHVTCAGRTAEKCSVVLIPPKKAGRAVLVVLPLAYSAEGGSPQDFAHARKAAELAPVLRRLQQGPHGLRPVYYLACVPHDGERSQAELTLAAASLDWPHGNFVLFPSSRADFAKALT